MPLRSFGLGTVLALSLTGVCLSTATEAQQWSLNTYPGPGHAERPEKFGPGEGSDRAEWISGFGVSPLIAEGHDTPLMLQVTDLGPLVVSFDGKRFVPADLPVAGGHAVAFSPHDADRAYAFMRHDPVMGWDHGWWRSDDRGVSWRRMVEAPEIRGQQRNLLHDPHPDRAHHLYLAAAERGVRVSTDDGETWRDLAFDGRFAHTLAAVTDGDQTLLYAVVAKNARPVNAGNLGELVRWRIDAGGPGTATLECELRHDVIDVEVHSDQPGRLWMLTRASNDEGVVQTANADAPEESRVLRQGFMRRGGTVRVNPANADHIVSTVFGSLARYPYHVSHDGGRTWQTLVIETIDGQDVLPGLTDFGPFNHDSPRYAVSAQGHNKIDGERPLYGFWPGDPQRIVAWFTNMPKAPLLSEDGGLTYTPFATGGTFKPADQIAVGRDGRTRVLAMSEYGLLITTDAGRTWRAHHHINQPTLEALYSANQDHPNPWRYKTAWGVAVHPEDASTIVATYGWGPTHVIRSEDGGESWASVAAYHPTLASDNSKIYYDATGVFWHRQNPKRLHAGPLVSEDGGRTFHDPPGDYFVTAMSPHHGDVLACREFGGNFWVSLNGGKQWTKLPSPPRDRGRSVTANYNLDAIAFDLGPDGSQAQPLRLMIGGTGGVWCYTASAGQLAGGTWRLTRPTADGTLLSDDELAAMRFGFVTQDPHPARRQTYYATAGGYTAGDRRLDRGLLLRSTDAGQTWHAVDTAGLRALAPWWKPTAAAAVCHNTGDVYIPDYAGLYRFGQTLTTSGPGSRDQATGR
jgi:photosystem II stability/assembly factor-like uncharacterized protein